jgi:putative ABC transport system substrate-binding protein
MAIFNPANSGAALFVGSAEKAGFVVGLPRSRGCGHRDSYFRSGEAVRRWINRPPDTFTTVHHKPAARYRIPAVYARRFFVDEGGLLSYGLDVLHQYRQAAD